MINYKGLLILKLSGSAEWKNDSEMYITERDRFGHIYTCEFVDLESREYIIRRYRKVRKYIFFRHEVKIGEYEYKNDDRHGKHTGWFAHNGKKSWQEEYKNNEPNGKCISWDTKGNKIWQVEYNNGILDGENVYWHENGRVGWKVVYENGRAVSEEKYEM
jgi:antitoxin component YwqK of YwqJK toxin-antitoxin module